MLGFYYNIEAVSCCKLACAFKMKIEIIRPGEELINRLKIKSWPFSQKVFPAGGRF